MKPPKMPPQPLKLYQIRVRSGTSGWAYQIAVSSVRPGVTMDSTMPRKKLLVVSCFDGKAYDDATHYAARALLKFFAPATLYSNSMHQYFSDSML